MQVCSLLRGRPCGIPLIVGSYMGLDRFGPLALDARGGALGEARDCASRE